MPTSDVFSAACAFQFNLHGATIFPADCFAVVIVTPISIIHARSIVIIGIPIMIGVFPGGARGFVLNL